MQMLVTKADKEWLKRFYAKLAYQSQAARQRAGNIQGAMAYRKEYIKRQR